MNRREFTLATLGAAAAGATPLLARDGGALPTSRELWRWSAADLAEGIRRKDISSVEATRSAIERIGTVNPRINAVVEILAEEALAAAKKVDAGVRSGLTSGPLNGVPVTTKINVDYRGHATTNGVAALRNNIAKEDSAVVAALRRSGAVIVGRTNTPALSFRWFTDNDLHGRTLNPWRSTITPGGSSGGAGAAVAAGMGAIAHGNDIAGSVRYPGYACGVPALRPSLGRIANYQSSSAHEGGIASQLMAVQGVLARRVADVALGLRAMATSDPRDPWWTPAPLNLDPGAPVRVAMFSGDANFRPEPEVAAALASAARSLTRAGFQVEEVAPPNFAEAAELWSTIVMNETRRPMADAAEKLGDVKVRNEIEAWLALTPPVDLLGFSEALSRRQAIGRAWNELLARYPLILMPNSWEKPFVIDRDQGGTDAMLRILHAQSPMLAPALLGLPGMSVPTGAPAGIPMGVQIVAGRFREDLCIQAGAAIERDHVMPTPINPRA